MARTERKTGAGHQRFAWHADDVTLEQDLARRDLTINAIAKDGDALIDPFGGQADIERRLLRHVSPAFAEDPLRVFRVARFAATLGDFAIHPDTLALMKSMGGELAALSGERVWGELVKAAPRLGRFFEVVAELDGAHWFEALDSPRDSRALSPSRLRRPKRARRGGLAQPVASRRRDLRGAQVTDHLPTCGQSSGEPRSRLSKPAFRSRLA